MKQLYTSIGIGIMALAAMIGSLELPDHSVNGIILPTNPVKVGVSNDLGSLNNPIRRETEDSSQTYISYSESQRTQPRSSKF